MGGICEEIDAGWGAKSKSVLISSSGEKWVWKGRVYMSKSTLVGLRRGRWLGCGEAGCMYCE